MKSKKKFLNYVVGCSQCKRQFYDIRVFFQHITFLCPYRPRNQGGLGEPFKPGIGFHSS